MAVLELRRSPFGCIGAVVGVVRPKAFFFCDIVLPRDRCNQQPRHDRPHGGPVLRMPRSRGQLFCPSCAPPNVAQTLTEGCLAQYCFPDIGVRVGVIGAASRSTGINDYLGSRTYCKYQLHLKAGRLLDAQRKLECCVTGERD